jgi:hypothetical protein
MTTEQYLLELIAAKNDMKEALREKGVEVWGGLNTYPDAIRELVFTNKLLVYEGVSFGNSDWVNIPSMNTEHIVDMSALFVGCDKLDKVSLLDISSAVNTSNMFNGCTLLRYVKFKGRPSHLVETSYMFEGCTNLVLYYPGQFASDYEPIIQELVGKGTAFSYNE